MRTRQDVCVSGGAFALECVAVQHGTPCPGFGGGGLDLAASAAITKLCLGFQPRHWLALGLAAYSHEQLLLVQPMTDMVDAISRSAATAFPAIFA